MTQPPSLVWGQQVKTTAATIVIPLDNNTQQSQALVATSGATQPKPWSELQSDMCLTRNDPCTPATPTVTGSTLGAGTGLAGVIVYPGGGGNGGTGSTGTDYWAYNAATGACELNPPVMAGTPTYATEALCIAGGDATSELPEGITDPTNEFYATSPGFCWSDAMGQWYYTPPPPGSFNSGGAPSTAPLWDYSNCAWYFP